MLMNVEKAYHFIEIVSSGDGNIIVLRGSINQECINEYEFVISSTDWATHRLDFHTPSFGTINPNALYYENGNGIVWPTFINERLVIKAQSLPIAYGETSRSWILSSKIVKTLV